MTSLDADLRSSVRSLYERLPYPPPEHDLDAYRDHRRTVDGSPAHFFPMYWPDRAPRDDLRILVAGCGTSQAAKIAVQCPAACVTAVDLSLASLEHTRVLRDRYDLDNLDVEHHAIEAVETLGRSFDLVVCTGVLHHLPDPDAGLRALRGVLEPEGAMHLMVYASFGRMGVYLMQEYCSRLGIEPEAEEIRGLADTVRELPAEHPIHAFTRVANDLTHDAGVADALLHPSDRAYTVPQVYEWLDTGGMMLDRWFLQAPYLPQCGAASRGAHAPRLTRLPTREQHAVMELRRGTMITHTLVAGRDDRPARRRVDLEGETWPAYVPIAFPGAAVRTDDLPADAVAVLRHPGHHDRDLEMPLDAAAARLYQAVDGTRTLAEIATHAGVDAATVVRPLFTRLWRHDQILFRI